jgi:opine dehydrogenase
MTNGSSWLPGSNETRTTQEGGKMKVGILGAGAIAFGTAAYLERGGHTARLWSPSGAGTSALEAGAPLQARGAVEGDYRPEIAADARDAVAGVDVVLLALPANGHKAVLDAVAPFITADQTLIISSHHAFGALYAARLLAARGIVIPVVAWGTTLVTARRSGPAAVAVSTVRAEIDGATVPARLGEQGLAACLALFGDRFREREGLLAIALSNVNPQNHMALALCNFTRMESGESWEQMLYYTPAVGRLIEALDAERLAIAAACGVRVRTIFEHLHLSYHVPVDRVSGMMRSIHEAGRGGLGPTSLDTRYVLEDCPFGLVTTVSLGRLAGVPAPLHEGGVRFFSALYGADFAAQNDLVAALQLERMTLAELRERATSGYAPA